MKKSKKANYPLAIFLNVLSLLLAIGGVLNFVYQKLQTSNADFDIQAKQNMITDISFILFVILIAQFILLKKPLKRYLDQAVKDNEYDEFGVSKKKKFENLTRKERETMDLQKASQMEQILSTSVMKNITKKGSESPEKDLNNLIGLAPIKQRITEMSARMKFESEIKKKDKKKRKEKGFGSMSGNHFCFYGSAGTGKTTLARIITGFLYQYGYIKENKIIEIDGNFLKAGEDSATKTKMIIQKSFGGVLFVDEAYTILDGSGGYGREVIATLIKAMEDYRDRFILIIAGYKPDMKRLLDSNEGFKSRIKEYLEFPDYSVQEMKDIFSNMANSMGFCVSEGALNNFEIRCSKEKKLSSFGNARTVRNILDETIDKHAVNYGLNKLNEVDGKTNSQNKFILTKLDISTVANTKVL